MLIVSVLSLEKFRCFHAKVKLANSNRMEVPQKVPSLAYPYWNYTQILRIEVFDVFYYIISFDTSETSLKNQVLNSICLNYLGKNILRFVSISKLDRWLMVR